MNFWSIKRQNKTILPRHIYVYTSLFIRLDNKYSKDECLMKSHYYSTTDVCNQIYKSVDELILYSLSSIRNKTYIIHFNQITRRIYEEILR